jgi:hypothetical protein
MRETGAVSLPEIEWLWPGSRARIKKGGGAVRGE